MGNETIERRADPRPSDQPYVVGPIFKALKLLDAVAMLGHSVTLTRIAAELKLPKTTAFRYLRTLTAAGFLSYDARTDRYGIGNRFRAIAQADRSIERLRDSAHPFLVELHAAFNETVNLAVMAGGQIVYIDMLESSRAVRLQARIGSRDPVHSTALGKAILARLPVADRTALLARTLPQRTVRTLVEGRSIEQQLREIERTGIAVEIGENEVGTTCIGVAITEEGGHPVAAISLSAPERRVTPALREKIVAALRHAADGIAARLAGES